MRRIRATTVGSGLLVCMLGSATVLTSDTQASPPAAAAADLARAPAGGADHDDNGGLGPPPWANAGGVGAERGKAEDSWKDDWQSLTRAQRTQKMSSLARAHEDGMRSWTQCVRAAGTDAAKRWACEKPLPPGLAKKQS